MELVFDTEAFAKEIYNKILDSIHVKARKPAKKSEINKGSVQFFGEEEKLKYLIQSFDGDENLIK